MTDTRTEYERLLALQAERVERRIPPSDDDRKWFKRNQRSNGGRPRRYRVRSAVVTDHPVFQIGDADPAAYITIISGHTWEFAVILRAEDKYGPTTNCDEYANWRIGEIENGRLAREQGVLL